MTKIRSLASTLCLCGCLATLFSLPLFAQVQTNGTSVAPTQLQQNPAPPADASNPLVPGPAPAPSEPSAPSPGDPAAPAPNSGLGSPGQNPPPSDPNSLIPPPEEPQQPSPVNTGGDEEKQRQEQKARYYAVKVKADKEEALSSLQEQADKAKTDEGKRQALREYYDLLAKRMKKLDSSLSDWIDTMHAAYLRRLDQVRVEPTIPLNLPPSVNESASPSPTPEPSATPRHKKRKAVLSEAASSSVKMESSTAKPAPTPMPVKKAKLVAKPTPTPKPPKKAKDKTGAQSSPSPSPTPTSKKKAAATQDD